MKLLVVPVLIGSLALGAICARGAEPRGYQASVRVTQPTRLDTVFPLANQSLAQPPDDWYAGYDSTTQTYERFVPTKVAPGKKLPLIVFVPPGATSGAWRNFQPLCEQAGVVFAAPHNAGNDCPMPRRVRIVLDVLDDLRRQLPIDPDRTYITGFSGGGRVACHIAFALPELFGGVMPLCASESLREEPWLRHRVIDRLSVALVTGETDFNRGEVERYRGALLEGSGVRTKTWVVPALGHGVPAAAALTPVFQWLEQGLPARQKMAGQFPASRLNHDAAPSRAEAAEALRLEAMQRLQRKDQLYRGLMQLMGLVTRWSDVPAAAKARQTLAMYEAQPDRPWEAEDLREQRTFLLAEARGLTAYATGPLDARYAQQRDEMVAGARQRWELLLGDQPQGAVADEARQKLAELAKLSPAAKP